MVWYNNAATIEVKPYLLINSIRGEEPNKKESSEKLLTQLYIPIKARIDINHARDKLFYVNASQNNNGDEPNRKADFRIIKHLPQAPDKNTNQHKPQLTWIVWLKNATMIQVCRICCFIQFVEKNQTRDANFKNKH